MTKGGSKDQAVFGDIILYSYEITNNDSVDLHDVILYDDRLGNLSLGELGIGETKTWTINHTIVESDYPGPLNNKAWATGKMPNGTEVRSNDARWEVALGFVGNLVVSKSADVVYGYIGKSINYTITVKNPNGFALKNLTVQDLIYHPTVIKVEVPLNKTMLLPGESALGTVTYFVTQDDILGPPPTGPGLSPAIVTDSANVVAFPPWSDPRDPYSHKVSNVATRNIGIRYTTAQSVSKTASLAIGAKGDRTTFNITVANTGDTLINRSELIDYLPNGLKFISSVPPVTSLANNSNGSTTLYWENLSQSFGTILNPGKIFKVSVTAEFSGSKYGKLTNTVISRVYNLRREVKSSPSSADVYAMKQNIVVLKTPDISVGAPDTVVNYTLQVQNTGNISLNNVFVSDILPEGMSYVSSSAGGSNLGSYVNWSDIGPLAIGSEKQLWVKARINGPVSERKALTNHVYVEGRPEFGYNISNSTSANVEALEANITITKGADPTFGSPGTIVTFSINVTNNGVAALPHVNVSDILPVGMSYISSAPEGTVQGRNVSWADIGPLGSGETRQLEIAARIDGPISGIKLLTNQVWVSGSPEHGSNVSANASATVQSGEARIDVVKRADPTFGSPSTNVTFSLNITNSGAVPLVHIFASDLLPTGMRYVSSDPAGTNLDQNVSWADIGSLMPGESKRLEIVAHIDGPIGGSKTLTNLVRVSGSPEHGDNVTSNASADVQAREARIDVKKTASPASGSAGSLVNFTMNVTNDGAARLPHVFACDTLPEGMSYVSSSPAGINQGQRVLWADIGPLEPGQSRRLEIVARLDGPITGNKTLTNQIQVSARPEHGQNVTASDSADVFASEAKINVVKTSEPRFGSPCTNVTFTLNVTNTGSAPLPVVSVTDLLPAGLRYVSSSPEGINQDQKVIWPNVGPMSPGSTKKLEVIAHLDGPISGNITLTNQVEVTGKPEHGENVTTNDTADIQASEAKIAITKTANPSFGSPSTIVTFSMDVTNNGAAPLPHVFVSDQLPAGLSYVSSSPEGMSQGQNVFWSDIGPMPPGSTKRLELRAHIEAPVSGNITLTNQVQVSAQPEHGQNVTASASAEVQASEARIAITKAANPPFGSPGSLVTFTMNVTNSGAAPLLQVSARDLLPAGLSYLSSIPEGISQGQNVLWPDIGPLAPGEAKRLQIIARIDGPLSGIVDLTNLVQATGRPKHGGNVTANATATVRAKEARINLTKTADPNFGSPGTEVTFTLNVTNSGSALLPNVFANDLLPSGMSYISSSPAGTSQGQNILWSEIGPMEPGASRQLKIVARIDGPITGSTNLTNQADVSGKPEHGDNVTASASARVLTSEARIVVAKSAQPAYGSPGTDVTFDLEVENAGAARLPHIFVRDLLPSGMSYKSSSPAGTSQGQNVLWPDIGPLAPGEKKRLQILARIDGPISNTKTLTNLVEVSGQPEHGENVTANDTAVVQANEANIDVVKLANPSFGSAGTVVTFALNVTNTGAALLPHVYVADLLPAGMSYISSSPTGINQGQSVLWPDIGPMNSGESRNLEVVARIDGPISGTVTFINQVEVSARPEYGDNVTASDSAIVSASEARIAVDKTADPAFGSAGSTVSFKLNVTNTGSALLPNVFVADLLPAGMSYLSSSPAGFSQGQNVHWPDIGPMGPGESRGLQITARIDGPLSGTSTFTNLVEVSARPEHGDNVTANDSAIVSALEAKVAVDKTADPEFGSPGTAVTFGLNVTNTGVALLPHVFVDDLLPAGMSYVSSSPAGVSQGQKVSWSDIGPMAPGESRKLQILADILGPLSGTTTLTNQVQVSASPEHGENVTASDSAEVMANEANITVSKSASPSFGSPGTSVTFTLEVTNSGAASLPHIFVRDLLPAGMSYISSDPAGLNQGQQVIWPDIGPMDSGETKNLQILARIDGPISGSKTLTNHVEVTGQPDHGDNVTATAKASVQAREARIIVAKKAEPAYGSPGTEVKFTLNVTNSADAPLPHVFASDLLPAGMSYVSSSPPGVNQGQKVSWSNIGPMNSGESRELEIVARIEGPISGNKTLTNLVEVAGQPEHGENVTASASALVQASEAKINIVKRADPDFGSTCTNVTFTLEVTNSGAARLPHIFVRDQLPAGLSYVSSSPAGINQGQTVSWSDIGPMEPGAVQQLQMIAHIDRSISGSQSLRNLVEAVGKPEHGQGWRASGENARRERRGAERTDAAQDPQTPTAATRSVAAVGSSGSAWVSESDRP